MLPQNWFCAPYGTTED